MPEPGLAEGVGEQGERSGLALDLPGQIDHHASPGDVDGRNHGVGKWQQHGRALWRRDLDDVAGAEIMDADDAADRLVGRIHRGKEIRIANRLHHLADRGAGEIGERSG